MPYFLTLGKRGKCVVGLNVRLRDVIANADRDEGLECSLKLGVHVDSFLHGIVVDFVGEYNRARLRRITSSLVYARN